MQQQKIQQNQIAIEKEQALVERENQVAMAELEMKAAQLDLKAREIELGNATDNRELDIRQARYSQQNMADIFSQIQGDTNVGQTEPEGTGGDTPDVQQQPGV